MESELRLKTKTHTIWKKWFGWIQHTTVEPTMWLYMMAYMITSVVEQSFFVYKSCRVDHGYSEEVCADLNKNETIKTAVQVTVSEFHQWNNIAGHVVPIILALFFGNWSDRRGRKIPLILGLVGKFIYSFMIVVNSMMDTWNLNKIVYTASLPMGILGADVAIFGSCFAYISDISSTQQRTLRITIVEIVYLSTMPTGVALGSYLYTNVVKSSYTIMFVINTSLLALAIVYSLIRLKWQTLPRQQPLSGKNLLVDFFDKDHVVATIKTMTKSRPNHGKVYLWLLLLIMMLYTFQRDEKPMSFLYTQLKFKWDVTKFSNFRTFQSTTFVIGSRNAPTEIYGLFDGASPLAATTGVSSYGGEDQSNWWGYSMGHFLSQARGTLSDQYCITMLIGVPVMSKVMGIKDTIIVAIGAISHAAGRVIFAVAKIPELFYVGAGVAALGPTVAPVLRSMTSKIIPVEERGKVFAMLSVCDNAVPLFSGILYSQLYNATINTAPSSIYWLTFSTQFMLLLLNLIIHFTLRKNQYQEEQCYRGNETDCPSLSSISEPNLAPVNGNRFLTLK